MWKDHSADRDGEYLLQKRDSIIQLKIDSINKCINDYIDHRIYENDAKLNDRDKKISNNKIIYKERAKELLQNNSADSVYSLVKHKLHERPGN
jgi:hypothetical protein